VALLPALFRHPWKAGKGKRRSFGSFGWYGNTFRRQAKSQLYQTASGQSFSATCDAETGFESLGILVQFMARVFNFPGCRVSTLNLGQKKTGQPSFFQVKPLNDIEGSPPQDTLSMMACQMHCGENDMKNPWRTCTLCKCADRLIIAPPFSRASVPFVCTSAGDVGGDEATP